VKSILVGRGKAITLASGEAGMPCPRCNSPADGEGFQTDFDYDGWRN
jgi:hypothetical protein